MQTGRRDTMGLFRSKEEKRQKQIKELEELIASYKKGDSDAWQRNYKKQIHAIESLEKLVGTENLSRDKVELLMYHYDRERNEAGIDRILPVYSRYYAKTWLESDPTLYLIGNEPYDWDISVVAAPDLSLAMAYAEKSGNDFYQKLIGQLKEIGYPGGTKYWDERVDWLIDHLENPGARYLYIETLFWAFSAAAHIQSLSNDQLAKVKQYCLAETAEAHREIILKECDRRKKFGFSI